MPTPKLQLTVSLTIEQYESVRACARARGVTMAALARRAVLDEVLGLYEALRDPTAPAPEA